MMKEATAEQIVAYLTAKRSPEELMTREELLAEIKWLRDAYTDLLKVSLLRVSHEPEDK
jgi:hypothetical protein